jgi:hypothetical protein
MTFTPFKITKVDEHSYEELVSRLREVAMLKEPSVKPYAEANIELKSRPYSLFRPAQRYVLSDELLKVQHLEWELLNFGHHPLSLEGYLTIWTDYSDEPCDLLPPIIENITEFDGSQILVVNDGMHRLFVGRQEWRIPKVVIIDQLPAQYPYYAYPIPGTDPWEQVEILPGHTIPADYIKKWHRTADNKKLYRNFNSAFQNVGGPRGQG